MIIALPVDGVLAPFSDPANRQPDPPYPEALAFFEALESQNHEVIIHDSRANTHGGLKDLQAWLIEHGFPAGNVWVLHGKPIANIFIEPKTHGFKLDYKEILKQCRV